ncbi:voltage-dependent calcium channel beta subunit-associated regulatory protein [Polymixia lowei]
MSNDLPVLTSLTENSTDVPVPAGRVENYVLLLVLLCVFAGGTLVLLSLLLLFCHRCCMGGRRYSRASDDPEKTNTTYVEDSQPTQDITIRLDESDALSASSCHDGETERFVSTGSTGRRVSFNESALYEQERKTQDKGRRYTLTEGDFHHLKKARLTHLHMAPTPSALKILTIMECESTESSTININETPETNLPLAIYQPPERGVSAVSLDWMGQSLSGGLPGDPHHSVVLEQCRGQASSAMKIQHTLSLTEVSPAPGQTSVLQFFSKLRRHASLEGAGPYFRKWKFDSSHRAASLDAKGSPKRRPFQRQRAASETTDHTEDDASPLGDEIVQPFPHTPVQTGGLQSLSAESLSHPVTLLSPSAFICRLEVEAMVEIDCSSGTRSEGTRSPTVDPRALRREKDTGEAETQAKTDSKSGAATVAEAAGAWLAAGDDEGGEDDLFEERDVGIQEKIGNRLQENEVAEAKPEVKEEDEPGVDEGADEALGAEARVRADSGSSLSFMVRRESSEVPPSLYRDIWSLRASLEQYASSDQSSTDRESIRSDADSISSLGGARSALDSCLSQDLDDEPEGEGEGEGLDGGVRGASGGDSEAGSGAGGEGEAGSRKLLQMDSGYASIEAPSRAPEELRLFAAPGGPRGKTASERRLFFTSSGRKGSVCESFETKVFQEELEDEMADSTETEEKPVERSQIVSQSLTLQEPSQLLKPLHPQKPLESLQLQSQPTSPLLKPVQPLPQPSPPHRPRLRRRDYSIDEKTDALFNEFLRHDPRFDQQDSPLRSRHRSRVHLRKQWQRHKQYSDPGSGAGGRYSPSLERQRFTPLRRGDSAGYPLDTRYHSTLSRIASAADEEANEGAACDEATNEGTGNKDSPNGRVAGEATERAASITSEDDVSAVGSSCTESASVGNDSAVSANRDTANELVASESTATQLQKTMGAQASCMDPRVDNRNNNSSQAILSDDSFSNFHPPLTKSTSVTHPNPSKISTYPPSLPPEASAPRPILQAHSGLADKLAASLDERLYTGLRSAEQRLGKGGAECLVTAAQATSPGHSPI